MNDSERLSNPIDYIFYCLNNDKTPSKFDILNAKDELDKIRKDDYFVAGWARLNYNGDLYDFRTTKTYFVDENTILPLYINSNDYSNKSGSLNNDTKRSQILG